MRLSMTSVEGVAVASASALFASTTIASETGAGPSAVVEADLESSEVSSSHHEFDVTD